ncbi:MAG TPA: SRPBCC family protein [bacterium]|nr:SRPBCC family protein [bacterium]
MWWMLAAVAISGSATDLTFNPENLDTKTLRTLAERGTSIIVDSDATGALKLVTAGIVVNAPPQAVFDTAMDFSHFPEFMPQVESAKVDIDAADHKNVQLGLKFKFSVISTSMKYTERVTWSAPERITFQFIEGDLTKGGGSYRMLPIDGGSRTLLFYSTISDLRSTGFLTRTLIKEQPPMEAAIQVSTASVVAQAIKKRAESKTSTTAAAR